MTTPSTDALLEFARAAVAPETVAPDASRLAPPWLELIPALRTMPLFEALSDEQLAWLAEHGRVIWVDGGTHLFREGDPADAFYVILEGELQVSKRVGGHEVVVVNSDQPGAWVGQVPGMSGSEGTGVNIITVRILRPTRLFRIASETMGQMLARGFPILTHLLAGISSGTRRFEALVGQHEKLQALGKLAAGLAHELNNPASAARRATAQLREVVREQQAAVIELAAARSADGWVDRLELLEQAVVQRAAVPATLGTLARSDSEDEVTTWLEAHGVARGWETAGGLVDAGLDAAWLEETLGGAPDGSLDPVIRWLAATSTSARLMNEVEEATARVAELVEAVKSYSYMDQESSPEQEIDVHEGLESTLTMLTHKLGAIEVERDFSPSLPRVYGHGGELNQVWTNLIDNAIDALGGRGHIKIRTTSESGDHVVVEIGDDGPGIPPEIQSRIFEPFFTTKGVGEGTGLGLDVAYRVVVGSHGGEIGATSQPGQTTFRVRLPVQQTPSSELLTPSGDAALEEPGVGS